MWVVESLLTPIPGPRCSINQTSFCFFLNYDPTYFRQIKYDPTYFQHIFFNDSTCIINTNCLLSGRQIPEQLILRTGCSFYYGRNFCLPIGCIDKWVKSKSDIATPQNLFSGPIENNWKKNQRSRFRKTPLLGPKTTLSPQGPPNKTKLPKVGVRVIIWAT